MSSRFPLIDKPETSLRAENAKPENSMSNEMKKIEELYAPIDKDEVESMENKMNIRELALGFTDQKLDMKRLSLLQKNENFKR